jgi:plastocyanin
MANSIHPFRTLLFSLMLGGLGFPAQAADIVEMLNEQEELKRFSEAISSAGLAETLKREGPFTVFAPTDEAVAARQPSIRLQEFVRAHIVEGEAIPADAIPGQLQAMDGPAISVIASDAGVTLARGSGASAKQAMIVEEPIAADNGIIYVVDAVLATEARAETLVMRDPPPAELEPLRDIPFSGALAPDTPPEKPMPPMKKQLEPWVKDALGAAYQRPIPQGEALAVDEVKAVEATGQGPIVQALAGPPVFPDAIPPTMMKAMPPEANPLTNNVVELSEGEVKFAAIDRTKNDTATSEDSMAFAARFTDHEGNRWEILQVGLAPMSPDPVMDPWFGGVAIDVPAHGDSGNGPAHMPKVRCMLCSWGWADVWMNGKRVGSSVPLHVMLSSDTRDDEKGFQWTSYDASKEPVREIHVMVMPEANLPVPGGFLHVMWENAEWSNGTPEEVGAEDRIAALESEIGLDIETVALDAVEYLAWSKDEIKVEVGKPIRLVLNNHDPIAGHAFMMDTPEGHVHVPLPHGSPWATTVVLEQPGAYEFWCPVGNHRGRGMYGKIIATAPGDSTGKPPTGATIQQQ